MREVRTLASELALQVLCNADPDHCTLYAKCTRVCNAGRRARFGLQQEGD